MENRRRVKRDAMIAIAHYQKSKPKRKKNLWGVNNELLRVSRNFSRVLDSFFSSYFLASLTLRLISNLTAAIKSHSAICFNFIKPSR